MRSLLLKIVLLFAALAACVLLAELALRIRGTSKAQTPFYTLDRYRGWALRPKAEGWQRKEGETFVSINQFGLHNREVSLKKSTNSYRVLVLGDSFTEALQVPLEKNFVSVIENSLASCPALSGKEIETLNFGVQGYGTAQQLLTLRHVAWNFQPDFVVLAFFPGNDVYDNHPKLNPNHPELAPYFIHSQKGKLALSNSYEHYSSLRKLAFEGKRLWLAFQQKSYFAQFLSRRIPGLSLGGNSSNKEHWQSAFGKNYLDWFAWTSPPAPEMEEAWRITEELIVLMQQEVQQRNIPFLLSMLSAAIQVHPDSALRDQFLRQFRLSSLYYPENRLRDLSRSNRIPLLPLAKPLLQIAEEKKSLLHGFDNLSPGFGHLNRKGHQHTGELMAKAICSLAEAESKKASHK